MTERQLLFLMNAEQATEFARLVRAAEAGDGAAACRLGDLYREGAGGLRYSPKETFRWYSRSALAGDANGQNNLGACYEHGLGCRQSYARAVKWYRLAAARQVGTASMNLGYCYLRGKGIPADRPEALRLFRLAVKQGEPKARDELERLGEPVEEPGAGTRVQFRDVTEHGVHIGLVGVQVGAAPRGTAEPPAAQKIHAPADKASDFDWHALLGREPEDFDDETAPRYREYLARKGLTKRDLAWRRHISDVQRRAWEKDDCFDLPPPGSEAYKRLLAAADEAIEHARRKRAEQDRQLALASAAASSAETPRTAEAAATADPAASHSPAPDADRAN